MPEQALPGVETLEWNRRLAGAKIGGADDRSCKSSLS